MTRAEIAQGALEEAGHLAAGEAVEAEDLSVCNRKLDAVLGELGLDARLFSQRREATIDYTAGVATVTIPANFPALGSEVSASRITDAGTEAPMRVFTEDEWERRLPDKAATGAPQYLYRGGDGTWNIFPVPEENGQIKAYYTASVTIPGADDDLAMPDGWGNALILGVAFAIAPVYGVAPTARVEMERRWLVARRRMIANDVPAGAVEITVED